MRAKRCEMASNQFKNGQRRGDLAPKSAYAAEKRPFTSATGLCTLGISAVC
jgi:hypothetical protein